MKRNTSLKMALFEQGITQRELARKVGLQESQISMAIRGRLILNLREKEKVSKVLKRPINELFDS
jgi:transcriptional regulator with XRE-family HTH domain